MNDGIIYSRYRQPKDDIQRAYYDPWSGDGEDGAFIHQAARLRGPMEEQEDARRRRQEGRRSLTRRFIHASDRVGLSHVLPSLSPLWNWLLRRLFPGYYLRRQHSLAPSDLQKMSAEELLELLRLGVQEKDAALSRSVAKELERRARTG